MLKSNAIVIIAAVVGLVCGLASLTSLLAGQWFNLVVWAIVGLVLGLFTAGRRQILWTGIVYGVFLSVTFLLAGFQGSPDNLPGFLVLTLLLSVAGAIGGLVTVLVGSRLRRMAGR